MPLGFCSLGTRDDRLNRALDRIEKKGTLGLVCDAYHPLIFCFSPNVLKLLLDIQTPSFDWSACFKGYGEDTCQVFGWRRGFLTF